MKNVLVHKTDLKSEDQRFINITRIAYLFGALGHLLIGITLYVLKIPELMWMNFVFSVPVFVLAFGLNLKGWYNTALLIAIAELLLHQIAMVYFLGWKSGAQYYLIYLAGVSFFNPKWSKSTQFFVLSTILLTFASIYLLFRNNEIYTLSETVTNMIFLSNSLSSLLLLTLLINYYVRAAIKAENELAKAHQRTRDLLLNILPVKIADRLEEEAGPIADVFPEASILFSDLAGFTEFSKSLPAEKVVEVLNSVFSGFDAIVESHGLEKIKTIGDGYMVASGIPEARSDHAEQLIKCAEEMLKFLEKYNQETQMDLQLRIGINSGKAVAGIIGTTKFAYDLWGDTVNTASRMESHGIAGKIHISRETHQLINGFRATVPRGVIEVKGKGPMETFFIE